MRRLSKHDVNKLSVAKLKEMLPFEVVADGEVAFVAYDVNRLEEKPKANHDVNIPEDPVEGFVVVGGVRLRKV